MTQREPLLDRFIRYAKIDTQSSETSTTFPSTEKQKDLLRVLVDDLKAAGLADAAMDEWGYVMATLPSNVPAAHPAHGRVPAIGLIAHVDTYFGVTGANVNPQVHRDYDGGDIVLPGDRVAGHSRGRRDGARRVQGADDHHDRRHDAARRRRQGRRGRHPRGALAVAREPGAPARPHPRGVHARRGGRARHRAFRREGVRGGGGVHDRRLGARARSRPRRSARTPRL